MRIDRRKDGVTKQIVAFRNFATAPKNVSNTKHKLHWYGFDGGNKLDCVILVYQFLLIGDKRTFRMDFLPPSSEVREAADSSAVSVMNLEKWCHHNCEN